MIMYILDTEYAWFRLRETEFCGVDTTWMSWIICGHCPLDNCIALVSDFGIFVTFPSYNFITTIDMFSVGVGYLLLEGIWLTN